jgi:hypothetical protein
LFLEGRRPDAAGRNLFKFQMIVPDSDDTEALQQNVAFPQDLHIVAVVEKSAARGTARPRAIPVEFYVWRKD